SGWFVTWRVPPQGPPTIVGPGGIARARLWFRSVMMKEELDPDSMPDNKGRASVREPNMPSSFEADYPAMTRWIKEFGHIEIGHDSFMDNFVKALDRGGMPWGGRSEYATIDEALNDLERGIKAFVIETAGRRATASCQVPTRSGVTSGRGVEPR